MIMLYVVGKTIVEQDGVIWLRRNTGVTFIEAQLRRQDSVSWVVFVCVFVNHVSQTRQLLLILG